MELPMKQGNLALHNANISIKLNNFVSDLEYP